MGQNWLAIYGHYSAQNIHNILFISQGVDVNASNKQSQLSK